MDFGKNFGVDLDNTQLIAPTPTSNYFGSPDGFKGPGTLLTPEATAFAVPDFGVNSGFRDQARRITNLTLNHTSSSAVFTFYYNGSVTGGTDESWGIDNIVISDNNPEPSTGGEIPEPATIALTGIALAILAIRKRH